MKLSRAFRPKRVSLRWAWVCVISLVFQQLALAAYVCPTETMPLLQVMTDCGQMEYRDPAAPALCAQHTEEQVANVDVKPPQAPPSLLPSSQSEFRPIAAARDVRAFAEVPTCRSDPPVSVRFCSFQI
jgi:hypothetical protein